MKKVFCILVLSTSRLFATEPQPPSPVELNREGATAYASGHYSEAASYLEKALRLQKAQPTLDSTITTSISYNLAAVYRQQARYKESEALYRVALENREAQSGTDHASLIPILWVVPAQFVSLHYSMSLRPRSIISFRLPRPRERRP